MQGAPKCTGWAQHDLLPCTKLTFGETPPTLFQLFQANRQAQQCAVQASGLWESHSHLWRSNSVVARQGKLQAAAQGLQNEQTGTISGSGW